MNRESMRGDGKKKRHHCDGLLCSKVTQSDRAMEAP